ncbi:hypothetical protein Ddye_029248 [Dipteronia dyeriana]|uniref:MULE transposase domain-containing protein n=1 Tax=Dipteronia dyeriana TaxID=168575 RepID=A0AAD9WKG7_9ROSI|nr:hypothetical protein Ddye_029248 [Dipteronia dyeriana]
MDSFYKGQIFDTKQKLKNEFGNYVLTEKFNPRIRRLRKYQVEVGCNNIKCDFALKATCRVGCTYWVVRKIAHAHTCSLDTCESHFRKCIKGFLTVIHPVIAIDATHLNGAFKGAIYVALCKDGDEHAYPIAFGIGVGEIESFWTWFLERLREAIREVTAMLFVFDRHANITKALSLEVAYYCSDEVLKRYATEMV